MQKEHSGNNVSDRLLVEMGRLAANHPSRRRQLLTCVKSKFNVRTVSIQHSLTTHGPGHATTGSGQ